MCISVSLGRWHDFERNVKEGNDEIFFFFLKKKGWNSLICIASKLDGIKLIK